MFFSTHLCHKRLACVQRNLCGTEQISKPQETGAYLGEGFGGQTFLRKKF